MKRTIFKFSQRTDGLVLAAVCGAGDGDAAGTEAGDGHDGGDGAAVSAAVVALGRRVWRGSGW